MAQRTHTLCEHPAVPAAYRPALRSALRRHAVASPRRALALTPVFALALGACATAPSPFEPARDPALVAGEPAAVEAALRARTARLRSLYAVVSLSYDAPDLQGSFDAAFRYVAPRSLRVTGFKDLIVTAKDLFDLELGPSRFVLVEQEDDRPRRVGGPAAALPREHPRYEAFYWAAEALFLPGACAPDAPVGVGPVREGELQVTSELESGAQARWALSPGTLAVRAGTLTLPDGRRVVLEYADYRRVGELVLPFAVVYRDPAGRATITARVREVELNADLGGELRVAELEGAPAAPVDPPAGSSAGSPAGSSSGSGR